MPQGRRKDHTDRFRRHAEDTSDAKMKCKPEIILEMLWRTPVLSRNGKGIAGHLHHGEIIPLMRAVMVRRRYFERGKYDDNLGSSSLRNCHKTILNALRLYTDTRLYRAQSRDVH